jgi:uncharacterized membrane protein
MQEALIEIARYVSLSLSALAILAIVIGAVEAVIGIARDLLAGNTGNDERRAVWLGFARWLVSGLTFQLAADIVQTTAAPTWDEIGRVAAIAGIRTFLTFFLDRDIDAVSQRERHRRSRDDDARRA